MVLDNISNCKKYVSVHPKFKEAFDFLLSASEDLAEGKHEIEGEELFALVQNYNGESTTLFMESHKKYIDIQYVISGSDTIGYKDISTCSMEAVVYNDESDYMNYKEIPDFSINLLPKNFVVFYPNDVHSPLIGKEKCKKIVVKIKL